ncbi:MAG: PAS-domain containing protein [Pseudomonadota bacterium]
MAALFAVAWRRDGRAEGPGFSQHPSVYALALAVYCTSWTYFGAVGTAASSGWDYLPIYLGPAIVFFALPGLVRRIGDIAERESITSLSDFLASRYGKSRTVAAAATLAAVMGSVPYIALQLKSVGQSFSVLATGDGGRGASLADETVLATAAVLAIFAILFGARRSDKTERNAGLMLVLAFEAVIKLVALAAVCALAIMAISDPAAPTLVTTAFTEKSLSARFVTITILSMAAIICLPRQFHVAMLERRSSREIDRARWLFPLYLAATSVVVVPITVAGLQILPASSPADMYVLALPLSQENGVLALLTFLGGFSAATGMVIVSTIALSTMVTNDLLVPALMRSGHLSTLNRGSAKQLLLVRRGVIVAILALSFIYYRVSGAGEALAQIGLLSFAAAIQFAPALIGGVYWRGGRRVGALAGLMAGMVAWMYTLFLPNVIGIETMAASVPALLDPNSLLGVSMGDSLTHGVVWSLGLNLLAYVGLSLSARERLRDRIQAAAFVGDRNDRFVQSAPTTGLSSEVTPDGLQALASRFLDREAVRHAFDRFEQEIGVTVHGDMPAEWRLIQQTERLLASALGASSARVVMSSAVGGMDVALGDVLTILDHQTRAERFDRHMLQSMLENIAHGISVVDQDQNLVAWNSAYIELFKYPPSLVRIGEPIKTLISYNMASGWIDGDPAVVAERRIAHMKAGRPHTYERQNPDERWLRITGSPMPGGGYVTSFADITADKEREAALVEMNETLEARVTARTKELEAMAEKLDAAREDAEGANASKTRFLAAASHDLLQPLNAARLFLGSIETDGPANAELAAKTDRAIQSADELLKGLLDISRLDHGTITPAQVSIPIGPLLEDLVEEAEPMALRAGLYLKVAPTRLAAVADPDFLTSILRNFLSNARRYTLSGGILLGARRRGSMVRIEVWDTGPGIPEDQLDRLFVEFQRLANADNMGIRGAGLGLSVAKRLADLMDATIEVRSVLGRGSMFAISVPIAETFAGRIRRQSMVRPHSYADLVGLRVLCVDDEPTILEAMEALLKHWGCNAILVRDGVEARLHLEQNRIDAVIADLDLGESVSGLELLSDLRQRLPNPLNVALLTANSGSDIRQRAASENLTLFAKPVDPDDLRAFLTDCAARPAAQAAE